MSDREEGFSLIELLVAIALIGIIMSGLAFGITGSLTVTRDSRERTVAANLASAEIDLANSIPNTDLEAVTLQRVERVGVTDFTIRRVSTWESGTPEALACTALANSASGQGRRFLQVNVTVTWQGIGLRGPVRASTAITPSVASYTAGKGHVAVTVGRRDGRPFSGVPVTLVWNDPSRPAPPGVPRTVTTTSIGCAFFTDFDPGLYRVEVSLANHVDSETGVQLGSKLVTVGDRETAKAGFTYDEGTGLNTLVAGDAGAVVPNELVVSAKANDTPYPQRTSAGGTGNDPRRSIGVATGDPRLFPYRGGWTAWAGCAHNDPNAYGGARTGFNPAPGVPSPEGTVTAGTLTIDILTRNGARGGSTPRRLYARDQGATSAPCDAYLEVGTFDAAGRLPARSAVLPYGNWRLYVEGDLSTALNGDPDKTAAGGLIEVRPGVTATYREPPAYVPEVLSDGPFLYHRLDESPTFSAADSSGFGRTGTYQSGVIRGVASFSATANRAIYLDGSGNGFVSTPTTFTNPGTLTVEIWFRTPSAGYDRGGKLAGFGNLATGTSTRYDRHLYLLDSGQLVFGVYPGSVRTIQSAASYNDGRWHHAVGTLGAGGLTLYVDGLVVAQDATVAAAENFAGFMRVGYDSLTSWPGVRTNVGFEGYVDEFAFYTNELTPAQVGEHWNARAGSAYPGTVRGDGPQLYYRFNDSAVAQDSSGNGRTGTYQGGATGGAASALRNDANPSIGFDGTAAGYVANLTPVTSPTTFSLELWLRTTSVAGGRLLGFGNALTGSSTTSDRHLYMLNDGRLAFGVYGASTSSRRVITSPSGRSYADGQWHHIVATFGTGPLGPGLMLLYVDGAQVQTSFQTVASTNYAGYWRIGRDSLTGWTGQPTSTDIVGEVDEVAVYTRVLSPQRVAAHYAASGRP